MAVLWEKRSGGTHYQVRSAGHSRRLYTDGVFHSAYNARQPVTGDIWDLLMLPAFLFRADRVRRILLLGVGGGAVVGLFRRYCAGCEIIGVERDRVHLYVAERFFGATGEGVDLHHAEATSWLDGYTGAPFDLIVDDLFGASQGEPVRAVDADAAWFRRLLAHLSTGGTLVVNFAHRAEFERCGFFRHARVRACFRSAFSTTLPRNENVVGVFARPAASASRLRKNLLAHPALAAALSSKRLAYRIRSV